MLCIFVELYSLLTMFWPPTENWHDWHDNWQLIKTDCRDTQPQTTASRSRSNIYVHIPIKYLLTTSRSNISSQHPDPDQIFAFTFQIPNKFQIFGIFVIKYFVTSSANFCVSRRMAQWPIASGAHANWLMLPDKQHSLDEPCSDKPLITEVGLGLFFLALGQSHTHCVCQAFVPEIM